MGQNKKYVFTQKPCYLFLPFNMLISRKEYLLLKWLCSNLLRVQQTESDHISWCKPAVDGVYVTYLCMSGLCICIQLYTNHIPLYHTLTSKYNKVYVPVFTFITTTYLCITSWFHCMQQGICGGLPLFTCIHFGQFTPQYDQLFCSKVVQLVEFLPFLVDVLSPLM